MIGTVIPAAARDDVADTIESVVHWTPKPRVVVVVDDTGRGPAFRRQLESVSPDVTCIPAPPAPPGPHGGLWLKIGAGLEVVLDASPDVILRLDADALMIGEGAFEAATDAFATDPRLGLLGSYRVGSDGGRRDWAPARRAIAAETSVRGLRRPRRHRHLRRLRALAAAHGYPPGAHPLGGAYFLSPAFAAWLRDGGHLSDRRLGPGRLSEDQLAGLLAFAGGFTIGDLGGPGAPLALRWRGLPAAPADLLREGKSIIHSVRFYEDLDEDTIRATFQADRRRRGPCAGGGP